MKLIESVKPVTNAKKTEIERELNAEKARFKDISQEMIETFRSGLSIQSLTEEHAVETAIVLMVGGLALAHAARARKRRRS